MTDPHALPENEPHLPKSGKTKKDPDAVKKKRHCGGEKNDAPPAPKKPRKKSNDPHHVDEE